MSKIIDFLEGTGKGPNGFLIGQVLLYTDARLEGEHDYIQWLFPLKEESECVPGSPVLYDEDVEMIRNSAKAQQNLTSSYFLMLQFYMDNDHWLKPVDHNHRRITRILKSLSLLGGEVGKGNAREFHRTIMRRVEDTKSEINETTLTFWRYALPE